MYKMVKIIEKRKKGNCIMEKKNIIFLVIVLVFALLLTGCKNDESPERINEKTTKELGYFEERIFEIIIKLEKNEYLNEDNIVEWNKILEDAEKINKELDNLMLDLSKLSLSNEEIRNLSVYVNNVLLSVNNRNETSLLNELTNLYQTIPKYLKLYEKNENIINQKELKSYILRSYNYAVNNDWVNSNNESLNVENKYNEMISDSSYIEENAYNINKLYILIQEYKTAIGSNNFEVVRLKFIPLVSEI